MPNVNVGARGTTTGVRIATKKALKAALSDFEGAVTFDGTSPMGPQFYGTGEALEAGVKLAVVGPDPFTNRSWYATVERVNGKLKVS